MQYRVSGRRERISGSGAADRTLQKFKSPSGGGDHGQMRSGKKIQVKENCSLSQEGKWEKKLFNGPRACYKDGANAHYYHNFNNNNNRIIDRQTAATLVKVGSE